MEGIEDKKEKERRSGKERKEKGREEEREGWKKMRKCKYRN